MQVLALDMRTNVSALYRLMRSEPTPLDNWKVNAYIKTNKNCRFVSTEKDHIPSQKRNDNMNSTTAR
jgi:hypothetical protein